LPTKKILVLSDTHCGHQVGLTPPAWNPRYDDAFHNALSDYRDTLYGWFKTESSKFGKVDLCVLNGDAVEGPGKKSGGTENIVQDTNEQAFMALDILRGIKAKKFALTYGTPYHTGENNDLEDVIARELGCDIAGTLDFDINGRIFNFKHHISGSQVPHGRATALLRDKLWNQLWAVRGEYPQAHVIIRSHVHYTIAIDQPDSIAMITPALQGYGSKFGTRRVSGTVDYGFVYFEVSDNGDISWTRRILRAQRREALSI